MERLMRAAGLLLFAAALARAETPQDVFKRGNALYVEGKYTEAIAAYESAWQGGLQHWIVAYNLGDAYFRAGKLGKSVVQFERAFRLQPADNDVIDNLALTSARAGDSRVPASGLPYLFWRFFYGLGVNTLAVLGSLAFASLTVFLIGVLLGRWPYYVEPTLALVGLMVLSGTWLAARLYAGSRPTAVVVSSVAEVRSGPNQSYPANFTVPEGRRLVVLEEQEPVAGWMEIGVPQEGLKGWVPDADVERV